MNGAKIVFCWPWGNMVGNISADHRNQLFPWVQMSLKCIISVMWFLLLHKRIFGKLQRADGLKERKRCSHIWEQFLTWMTGSFTSIVAMWRMINHDTPHSLYGWASHFWDSCRCVSPILGSYGKIHMETGNHVPANTHASINISIYAYISTVIMKTH